MSEPFIVAAAIPMTAQRWMDFLDAPVAPPSTVSDWPAMFRGWFWDDQVVAQPAPQGAATNRALLARCVALAPQGQPFVVMATHKSGTARVWFMSVVDRDEGEMCQLIAALRGASRFASGRGYVLYWPEFSGTVSWPGMLSVSEVSPEGSRFVSRSDISEDLTDITKQLKPLEKNHSALMRQHGKRGVWAEARFCDPTIKAAVDTLLGT